ncbi:CCAAT/enhancer-binding protein zeta [Malaya genurostris]|uniref:CCAAT/enhancer-binding protein zeta n=1 Tax=Malaya genurostris TaxID=325434 RepID=UPI0026F3EE4D|nr:CCAAT/enhancer-binding protein zeta [Malaya genurostris]XP_058462182.1 CCAAT/enhancer-binding protein zeta [Malaya genurostris]
MAINKFKTHQKKISKTNDHDSASKQQKKKKIVFTDDGEQLEVPVDVTVSTNETDQKPKSNKKIKSDKHLPKFLQENGDTIEKRWYEHFDGYNTTGELIELKDTEISELRKLCKSAFDSECRNLMIQNPQDAKWLLTALDKGTTRDRANAGALLVQTNPLCNLQAFETVVGMVKLSNNGHLEVVEVLTELMLNSIMPAFRKLISLPLRGADWKNIKKLDIDRTLRDRIFAYWHFEDALRDVYFAFLNNLSALIQTGQDNTKMKVIQFASKLFTMIPEKEAYLLSMLINKLGDPGKKVAVKALYHLSEVAKKHSAMCPVIVAEAEKLLFRNNISASAQHYGLSFLAAISNYGDFSSCDKMINICFSFFKILTQKGEVNSRTMQSILTCLRKAIGNVKRDVDIANFVKPEVLDTVYRLIHLADISIACQGLSLLLEITESKGPEQNRFYNALYRKLLDPQIATIGPRITNIFFYILHRAIQNDPIPDRAQAFIKRLLQIAFYFPPARVCGVLIIINKVLRKRKNLRLDGLDPSLAENKPEEDEEPSEVAGQKVKTESNRQVSRYDPFHRASEFAGAKYSLKYELTRYLEYFHPTVRSFAQSIIDNTPLTYYGDPLRDFSLGHFLDRFAFKNPKKPKTELSENGEPVARKKILGVAQRKGDYVPSGSRGLPVHSLTSDRCTEDEQYIFRFLEQKRERIREAKELADAKKAKAGTTTDEDVSDAESLDDDEFDSYLDRLGIAGGDDDAADLDVDFMNEFEQDITQKAGKKKRKSTADEDDDEEEFGDWEDTRDVDDGDNDDDDEDDGFEEDEFSDGGSISLDEDGSDEEEDLDSGEDELQPAKSRNQKRKSDSTVNDKEFQKKLKTNDFNSLFAAADDFSEMLEKNVSSKDTFHGTLGEIFNKDNASTKQMAWEQARFSGKNRMQSGKKRFVSKKHGSSGGGTKEKKFVKGGTKKPFTKSKSGLSKVGGKRKK